ncbi:MAG: succinate dehydrogenase cytochrome b subunit [Bacteroidales bacterium]|jgi:succinate dehydrogenase/fumarate reductase cytochrome b subunit (b558 family)|nr:succinate dehydrogenase cytochrome b subunit [Bacteroidales bacterium]
MPKFLQFASITKKVTLAIIGLFLLMFLVVHLGINLCMLREDGGAWFKAAAHFMGTNYIVKTFEIVLFAAIILHIILAVLIQIHNWRARPVGYAVRTKSKTAPASKLMIWSGILIALFMGVHFVNFYFAKVGLVEGCYVVEIKAIEEAFQDKQKTLNTAFAEAETEEAKAAVQAEMQAFQAGLQTLQANEKVGVALQNASDMENLTKAEVDEIRTALDVEYEPDFYFMARQLFKNIWVVILYVACMIALGFHLTHAFQSAFQTLGLAHSKYTPTIKLIGTLFAVVVAVGFAIIPLFFYFFK